MNKCYKLKREDGEDLGTFDRRDEAQRFAEDAAREDGYSLRWTSTFGSTHGMPSTSGRGVYAYTITDADCE